MKIYKPDLIGGLVVVLVGVFFAGYALLDSNLTYSARTSDGVPGAGFFPILFGFLMALSGLLLVVRSLGLRAKESDEETGPVEEELSEDDAPVIEQKAGSPEEQRLNNRILLLTVLTVLAFLLFWKLTGWFYPALIVTTVILGRIFEKTWVFSVLFAVVFAAFIYASFGMAFSIRFSI